MSNLRILDLDLDYFVSPIIKGSSDSEQCKPDECKWWSVNEMQAFLEDNCGLSTNAKTPGLIVCEHKEVLTSWKNMVEEKILVPPFEVCHVDAHDDLGFDTWDLGGIEVCNELISLPVCRRLCHGAHHLTSGNYLLYALAYRWISSLILIRHPEDEDDECPNVIQHCDGAIRLEPVQSEDPLDPINAEYRHAESTVPDEPIVPLVNTKDTKLIPQPFDYVFLSLSPGFAPVESRVLAYEGLMPYLRLLS